ncbi:MAG TPA: serine hydrolase [Pyrinomonadaceae bacterium]|nr:serine hydrolase [Pyrinomonadaceae bacterium]
MAAHRLVQTFLCLLALACALPAAARAQFPLEKKIGELAAEAGAETVAVALYDLEKGHYFFHNPDDTFHAASTMKVAVMMELYRQAHERRLSLDRLVPVKNEFKSIADGSPFSVSASDDSEQTLYKKVGSTETVRELMRLMITESSNLATNILIELVTPERVRELADGMGAKGVKVLRGVEDSKAFERGMSNTTTARGLYVLLRAVAERRAVSREASEEMERVLLAQKFKEGLPAGLPAGFRVAHKTGSITRISHDAGIVYPPGRKPYVLVVLTRGVADGARARRLIADISRAAYEDMTRLNLIAPPAR